jgi:hypothetical protein
MSYIGTRTNTTFVPSDKNATELTHPAFFPGATGFLTCLPVRTLKITTCGIGVLVSAAATRQPSGENAIALIKLSVRRSSLPIRSSARVGKDVLASSDILERIRRTITQAEDMAHETENGMRVVVVVVWLGDR